MKKIILPLILLLGILVNASNEAYLTVDSKDSGLCLGIDSPDTVYCHNQTMPIDGTSDHMIYIMPQSEISDSSNLTEIAYFAAREPITFAISGFGYVLVLLGLFMALIYVIGTRVMGRYKRLGGRR